MTFLVPEDWKITDKEKFDNGSYYLSIDKSGFDSSGVLIITSYNDSIDLDELVNFQKKSKKTLFSKTRSLSPYKTINLILLIRGLLTIHLDFWA